MAARQLCLTVARLTPHARAGCTSRPCSTSCAPSASSSTTWRVSPRLVLLWLLGVRFCRRGCCGRFHTVAISHATNSRYVAVVSASLCAAKLFRVWRSEVRYRIYCKQRKQLKRNLFLARPSFCGPLLEVNKLMHELDGVKLSEVQDKVVEVTSSFRFCVCFAVHSCVPNVGCDWLGQFVVGLRVSRLSAVTLNTDQPFCLSLFSGRQVPRVAAPAARLGLDALRGDGGQAAVAGAQGLRERQGARPRLRPR